jgi:hypothetical protein
MNWRCLFGHKWKVLKYENFKYYSSDPFSFRLFYICKCCHKLNVKTYVDCGALTNEQFYEIWETTNVE